MSETATERDASDVPTAWFAVLERAIAERDRKRQYEALYHLERLGVSVTFHRTKSATKESRVPNGK